MRTLARLLRLEFYKLRKQRNAKLALAAVLMIDLICLAVAYSEGQILLDFATSNLQDVFILEGDLLNGSLVSLLILNSLWFHFPLLVIIVSASMVAAEYNDGSLRGILCRPIERVPYILAKYLAVAGFSALVVALLALTSLGLSYIFFGSGDLIVFMDTLNIYPEGEAIGRLVLAYGFGAFSMVTLGLMAACLATILESSVVSILVSTFLLIVLTLFDNSNLLAGSWIKNFALMGPVGAWQNLFQYEIPWGQLTSSLFWLLGYSLLFVYLGVRSFRRKDISC